MIVKQEYKSSQSSHSFMDPPRIGEYYEPPSEHSPHVFYRKDKALSDCVGGYQKGSKNSYAAELLKRCIEGR